MFQFYFLSNYLHILTSSIQLFFLYCEFIKLDSTESQYSTTNGIYKLFPYYQKLSPEKLTPEDSRFIIHKHVISGQWQLTEFYAYPLSKNIKAFPMTEKDEENALLNNRFVIFLSYE